VGFKTLYLMFHMKHIFFNALKKEDKEVIDSGLRTLVLFRILVQ